MDKAIDEACILLGLPLLGGSSGRGWSYYKRGFQCLQLFQGRNIEGIEEGPQTEPLQIGGLYHVLHALFYGVGLGNAGYYERGLLAQHIDRGYNRIGELPAVAADLLLAQLTRRAREAEAAQVQGAQEPDPETGEVLPPVVGPSLKCILEARRLFDAHTTHWDTREDVTPLAVEWLTQHPTLPHTCRYDMIGLVGKRDPLLPPGTYIFECKTARTLTDSVQEGWYLDGEILGQLMDWGPSGCEALFGPLAGLVVDIVTKEKTPTCHRVVVPAASPAVREFERSLRKLLIDLDYAQLTGYYQKSLNACWENRGSRSERRCVRFDRCRSGE